MKRVFIVLLCTFFSFTMLFALDSSTTGNVSLNVAIDSVAIGFVNTAEEAKNATTSTISTNHSISLTQSGTEYSYNGSLEFYFYWKIMTGEKNLKVSLSTDGPLILEGKTIDKRNNESDETSVTHVKVDGFKIPYWNEIKKMCLEASKVNDNVNVVGWDVGITDDGPVIIEGNRGPGMDIIQMLYKRGVKKDLEQIKQEILNSKLESR